MTIITITTIKIWKAQLHVSMIETKIGIPASSPWFDYRLIGKIIYFLVKSHGFALRLFCVRAFASLFSVTIFACWSSSMNMLPLRVTYLRGEHPDRWAFGRSIPSGNLWQVVKWLSREFKMSLGRCVGKRCRKQRSFSTKSFATISIRLPFSTIQHIPFGMTWESCVEFKVKAWINCCPGFLA